MGAAVLAAKSPETWPGWVDHVDVRSSAVVVVSTNIDDGPGSLMARLNGEGRHCSEDGLAFSCVSSC